MQILHTRDEYLLGQTASEIRGVTNIAVAVIVSNLGIRAERTRAIDLICRLVRSDDLGGSFARLGPLFHDADHIECVDSFSP